MKTKITQFGYNDDPYADTLTEEGWGAFGNKLTQDACALTASLVAKLGIKPMQWVRINFANGTVPMVRQFQDRAPESDDRCDLYMPTGYDPFIPDEADVEVITMTE